MRDAKQRKEKHTKCEKYIKSTELNGLPYIRIVTLQK